MGKEKEYSYLMIYGTGRLLAGDNELDDRDAREEQDRCYHHGVFLHSVPPFYRKETTRTVKNWVDVPVQGSWSPVFKVSRATVSSECL